MKKQSLYVIFFIVSAISCNNSERKVVSLSTTNKEVLLTLADSCYGINDFKKSIELFDRIVLLDSTMGEIYYKRGYCKAQTFDYKGSSKDFHKAFLLKYRADESLFNLGCNSAAIGNDTLALEYFSNAYELNPNNNIAKGEIDRIQRRLGIIELYCAVQVREVGIENETPLSNQTGKQTCTVRQVSRRKRVLHSIQ